MDDVWRHLPNVSNETLTWNRKCACLMWCGSITFCGLLVVLRVLTKYHVWRENKPCGRKSDCPDSLWSVRNPPTMWCPPFKVWKVDLSKDRCTFYLFIFSMAKSRGAGDDGKDVVITRPRASAPTSVISLHVHAHWSCLFNPAVPHSHKRALIEHPYATILADCACCAYTITFGFISPGPLVPSFVNIVSNWNDP